MSTEATSTPCACGANTAAACNTTSTSTSNSASKSNTAGIQNGKGDAPRNISPRFRENYDKIQWTTSKS